MFGFQECFNSVEQHWGQNAWVILVGLSNGQIFVIFTVIKDSWFKLQLHYTKFQKDLGKPVPHNMILPLLVTGHRLCTKSLQPQIEACQACSVWSWPCCTFVLLGLAVTTTLLINQVAMANLFCFCWPLCAISVFMTLTSWHNTEKYVCFDNKCLENWWRKMQFRDGMGWDDKWGGTGWHWMSQGYKPLSNGQMKKCRPGAGQKQLSWAVQKVKNKYQMYVSYTH